MIPFLEIKEHSENFWWIPEIRGLKPDEVVPADMILNEWQTRKGSDMVAARQYRAN